jgi:hypothetical protein
MWIISRDKGKVVLTCKDENNETSLEYGIEGGVIVSDDSTQCFVIAVNKDKTMRDIARLPYNSSVFIDLDDDRVSRII